jgi:hypothetical protein
MLSGIYHALWGIVPVSLFSATLVFWRAHRLGSTARLDIQASGHVRWELAWAYLLRGLLFGLLAALLYLWMEQRWPDTAPRFWLGVGAAGGLSALALILSRRGMLEYAALNGVWGLGFGWLVPRVIEWSRLV